MMTNVQLSAENQELRRQLDEARTQLQLLQAQFAAQPLSYLAPTTLAPDDQACLVHIADDLPPCPLQYFTTATQAMADILPAGGIMMVDRHLRYLVFGGPALHARYGSTRSFLGQRIDACLPPEIAEEVSKHYTAALNGNLTTPYDSSFAGVTLRCSPIALRDPSGAIIAVMVIAQDITQLLQSEQQVRQLNAELELRVAERTAELETVNLHEQRIAEEALLQQQRFVQRLSETAPVVIYVLDTVERRNIFANQELMRVLGYSPAELQALGTEMFARLIHPDDIPQFGQHIARLQLLSDDQIDEIEFRVKSANGAWRLLYGRSTPFLRDDNGNLLQVLGVVVDITARRAAEHALHQTYIELTTLHQELSENRDVLQTLIDVLTDGLVLLDSSNRVLAVNQAMATLIEKPIAELVGQVWSACCSHSAALVAETRRTAKPLRQQNTNTITETTRRTLDIRTYPLYDATGIVTRIVVHIVDVSEQLALEAMALQNERLASIGRLAATVAHEVNTPLQAMQYSLFLAAQAQGEQHNHYLNMISDEINRIGKILRRLLGVPKLGNAPDQLIDVNEVVERVLLIVSGKLVGQKIRVERLLDPSLAPIKGQTDYLTQVLLNLVLNASDAMEKGGTLQVRTVNESKQGQHSVRIEIEDNGPGIPLEILERIFDPFFSTKDQGTGIGLAVSQRLVHQLGGSIKVSSHVGQGTIFTVCIIPEAVEHVAVGITRNNAK